MSRSTKKLATFVYLDLTVNRGCNSVAAGKCENYVLPCHNYYYYYYISQLLAAPSPSSANTNLAKHPAVEVGMDSSVCIKGLKPAVSAMLVTLSVKLFTCVLFRSMMYLNGKSFN